MKKLLLTLTCCFIVVNLFGQDDLYGVHNSPGKIASKQEKDYKITIAPKNIVIGSSMIGASAAAYMISTSLINNSINKTKDLDKIEKLNNTHNAMGYICGGVSLFGTLVIIGGLKKEYTQYGLGVGRNTYIDITGGMSLTKVF